MIGILLSLSLPIAFTLCCAKNNHVKSRSASTTSLSTEKISTPNKKSAEPSNRQSGLKTQSSEDLKKNDSERLKVKAMADLEELAVWFNKHLPQCDFKKGNDTCECLDLKRQANAIVETFRKELQGLLTVGGLWKEVETKQTEVLEQVRVNANLNKDWERELLSEKTQISRTSSKRVPSKEKAEEKSKDTKSKDAKNRKKPKQEKSKQPDSGDKISKMSVAAPADAIIGEYEALIEKEKDHVVTQETQNSDST